MCVCGSRYPIKRQCASSPPFPALSFVKVRSGHPCNRLFSVLLYASLLYAALFLHLSTFLIRSSKKPASRRMGVLETRNYELQMLLVREPKTIGRLIHQAAYQEALLSHRLTPSHSVVTNTCDKAIGGYAPDRLCRVSGRPRRWASAGSAPLSKGHFANPIQSLVEARGM